jgi:hypothetical protein
MLWTSLFCTLNLIAKHIAQMDSIFSIVASKYLLSTTKLIGGRYLTCLICIPASKYFLTKSLSSIVTHLTVLLLSCYIPLPLFLCLSSFFYMSRRSCYRLVAAHQSMNKQSVEMHVLFYTLDD